MNSKPTCEVYDPLEALWAVKGSDPKRLKKVRDNLDQDNPSLEFRERVYDLVGNN